jgi:hypothetical protein
MRSRQYSFFDCSLLHESHGEETQSWVGAMRGEDIVVSASQARANGEPARF